MTVTVEVCIDNIESLATAITAGAHRIELCSALALGGLTPCAGFIKHVVKHSTIPIYAMVRPRAGDFIFSQAEIDIMVDDIYYMKSLGVDGVVVGCLTERGEINQQALIQLTEAAQGLGVTFHRAFDLCKNPFQALEIIIDHGCERILTSGLQASAELGVNMIAMLVRQADQRISIMPGAGVNANNARQIIEQTQANEIHLSGKTVRPGAMLKQAITNNNDVKMGNNSKDDMAVEVTSFAKVNAVVNLFQT